MAIQRLTIHEFLSRSSHGILLDVRSPAEYDHAHMPGAVNMPLFNNEERKIVGTIYKQQSREEAIKAGLDFFAPRMRGMIERAEILSKEFIEQHKNENNGSRAEFFLYCWRGGMRSAAIAWLLDLYGYKVYVLAGGYKAFRNQVLESFKQPFPFKVIGGYTGSGKTEVLRELQNRGEIIIDLEAIACHKGSAFGGYKMPPQPTQEMFENLLSMAVLRAEKSIKNTAGEGLPVSINGEDQRSIWVEDESQRIGNLNLPNALWETLRSSPIFFLEIPFEERLDHIMEEYGTYPKENLVDAIHRISKRLGGQHAKHAITSIEEENIKEAFRVLLVYYDKRYLKGLHNRKDLYALLTTVACQKVTTSNAGLLSKHQSV